VHDYWTRNNDEYYTNDDQHDDEYHCRRGLEHDYDWGPHNRWTHNGSNHWTSNDNNIDKHHHDGRWISYCDYPGQYYHHNT
jgi:hypothetical protein